MDIAKLTQLFNSWPDSNEYHISECDTVKIKYVTYKNDFWPQLIFHVFHCRFYCLGICLDYFYCLCLIKIKKVVSILDPIPIPTLGIRILKLVINNLNLALQVANPAFKDDISKWKFKVLVVPTNSHGYESFHCITILIDSFNS